jgi:ferredoxin-type protein NapH
MGSHEQSLNKRFWPRWVMPLVQVAFLGLFIALHLIGPLRIWLFLLIAGFVASPLLGRMYCRAVCPVNTCNRLAALLPRGMRLRRQNAPAWLVHPAVRAVWYTILLATLVAAMILRARFHLFTIITAIGIILCRVFPAALWCNGLCPWGALLRCGSRISQLRGKQKIGASVMDEGASGTSAVVTRRRLVRDARMGWEEPPIGDRG